jgi:ATP-binding cassette subfamily B protein
MISKEILSFPGARWGLSVLIGLLNALSLCAETLLICSALTTLTGLECLTSHTRNAGQIISSQIVRSFALTALLLIAADILLRWIAHRISTSLESHMTEQLTNALIHASLSHPHSAADSEKIAMISTEGVSSVAGYMTGYLPTFVEVLLMILFSPLILVQLAGWAGLAIGLGMLALPMVAMFSRKRDISVQMHQLGLYENAGTDFSEALLGMPDLKVFGADGRVARAVRRTSEGFRKATMDVLSGQLSALIGADTVIAIATTAATLIAALTAPTHTTGTHFGLAWVLPALATATISIRLFGPERQLVYLSHSAATAMRHGREISALLTPPQKSPQAAQESRSSAASSVSPALSSNVPSHADVSSPGIYARDLSVTYPSGVTALSGINLEFPPTGFIGIVGPSGCGKSTFVSLVTEDLTGYSGSLHLFGREISQLSQHDIVSLVTVVRGNDPLLSGTIRSTLNPAGMEISDDQMLHVLDEVGLTDELADRGGLDAPVSPGGSNFSGGQRQRLSLARALLRHTPILLLDEATSAVDRTHDQNITNLLRRRSASQLVVCVAHRLATVKDADQILVLNHGHLAQHGTFDQLAHTPGLFARQWNEQRGIEEER